MADFQADDIRALFKALDAIEPKSANKLKAKAKKATQPLVKKIKDTIPRVSPLRGMQNKGRLGWGIGKKADDVRPYFNVSRSRRAHTTALVKVQVNGAATAMTDYAGRRSSGNTRSGRAMIQKLNQRRKASRWAWFAAEKALPEVTREVKGIIDDAAKEISRGFK